MSLEKLKVLQTSLKQGAKLKFANYVLDVDSQLRGYLLFQITKGYLLFTERSEQEKWKHTPLSLFTKLQYSTQMLIRNELFASCTTWNDIRDSQICHYDSGVNYIRFTPEIRNKIYKYITPKQIRRDWNHRKSLKNNEKRVRDAY